ncbi:MAG: hypothetical protein MRJ96_16260 [Nitrospirales bacterium]|nr:hypothetical protein [Nitrospira sp.]MDR4502998.1 hypothetical protein [Nitrospirales bacterium]
MSKWQQVILFGIVSVFLASCAIPVDIRNSGFFQEQDLRDFADNWLRISSYQHSPGHINILQRGSVHMTGRYRFEGDSLAGGTTELGQIDLEINFDDRDEVRPGSYVIPITSGKISNITGLLPDVPDFGVGWSGEIPITGTISVEEAVGTEGDPPLIGFEAKGTVTSIPRRDGDAGSSREVQRIFSGTFFQEFKLGVFPLSAAGTVTQDVSSIAGPNNQFYLEQAR